MGPDRPHGGHAPAEPGTTKNREGRTVTLKYFPQIVADLQAQRARVEALGKTLKRVLPHVFVHLDSTRDELVGSPIRDFRRAWHTACTRAGAAGMMRHDFRRTAARNMERAGVPRSVAMAIIGHKTESVYRRYAIVDERSITEGSEKLAAFHATQAQQPATVVPFVATAAR